MTTPTFDINAAIQVLREGKDLTGKARQGKAGQEHEYLLTNTCI
ncbi:hypothetical protein [Shewanella sp.]